MTYDVFFCHQPQDHSYGTELSSPLKGKHGSFIFLFAAIPGHFTRIACGLDMGAW